MAEVQWDSLPDWKAFRNVNIDMTKLVELTMSVPKRRPYRWPVEIALRKHDKIEDCREELGSFCEMCKEENLRIPNIDPESTHNTLLEILSVCTEWESRTDVLGTGGFGTAKFIAGVNSVMKKINNEGYDVNKIMKRHNHKTNLIFMPSMSHIIAIHSTIKDASSALPGVCRTNSLRRDRTKTLKDLKCIIQYSELLDHLEDAFDAEWTIDDVRGYMFILFYTTMAIFRDYGIMHCDFKLDNIMAKPVETNHVVTSSDGAVTSTVKPIEGCIPCIIDWDASVLVSDQPDTLVLSQSDIEVYEDNVGKRYHSYYYTPYATPVFGFERIVLNVFLFSSSEILDACRNPEIRKYIVRFLNVFFEGYPNLVFTEEDLDVEPESPTRLYTVLERCPLFAPNARGIPFVAGSNGVITDSRTKRVNKGDVAESVLLDGKTLPWRGIFTTLWDAGFRDSKTECRVVVRTKNSGKRIILCNVKSYAVLWHVEPTLFEDVRRNWKLFYDHRIFDFFNR
jgi:hypothetical protein